MNGHLNLHCDETTVVRGHILTVAGAPVLYLEVESPDGGASVCLCARTPDVLDKLANEAERLTREFVDAVAQAKMIRRNDLPSDSEGLLP